MNAAASLFFQHLESHVVSKGGLQAFARDAVGSLSLKTVIKESHNSPIHHLTFNHTSPQFHNLFATVGGNLVTVYDDNHMKDFIAVVVQFQNQPTTRHAGGGLTVCAWVNCEGLTAHPHGDAWLAVAGLDPVIQVLSVVEAKIIAQLPGHSAEVVQLSGSLQLPGLLVSLDKSGTIRLWDVRVGTCIGKASSPDTATSVELHPEGCCFITGHRSGRLQMWSTPLTSVFSNEKAAIFSAARDHLLKHTLHQGVHTSLHPGPPSAASPAVASMCDCKCDCKCEHEVLECHSCLWTVMPASSNVCSYEHTSDGIDNRAAASRQCQELRPVGWLQAQEAQQVEMIDCLRFVTRNCLAVKACDGHIQLPDGELLSMGTVSGEVYVYHVGTGEQLAKLECSRSGLVVKACGLSSDGRHLLAACGKGGFLCRFESTSHGSTKGEQDITGDDFLK
ncbi:hypothetical protein CEUSTIGMA_g4039.t1 [Chlamydomonas eustigma]|uniref:Uncharacterized protein n=1 Tax=Chlamydomonas eustigma TaxID=1157962 RepID=A0A250X0I9_9CHLO|nr:hypothetical protein CEUSTIGMA_g4039.t1 [Chlamydomonas eustigma]|eukprot:GAX76593.1 hypothetical protein CEUSTIGMA_g4039.t1 [Chlamydomonas eustigma]